MLRFSQSSAVLRSTELSLWDMKACDARGSKGEFCRAPLSLHLPNAMAVYMRRQAAPGGAKTIQAPILWQWYPQLSALVHGQQGALHSGLDISTGSIVSTEQSSILLP